MRSVLSTVDRVRAETGDSVVYVCDPVLGDNGKLYCPQDMVAVYRDEALKRADLLTPNTFEASVLSGVDVTDVPSALRACAVLHDLGVPAVIIKSIHVGDRVVLVGSDRARNERFQLTVGRPLRYISGLGDLMGALLLAHSASAPSLSAAAQRATASVQAVLGRTLDTGAGELTLVAASDDIRAPPRLDEYLPELLAESV